MPDSTVKRIDRRTGYDGETWTTEQAALEWLHDQQAAGRKGEFAEPGKQKFGAYCREVMEGMRIRPQTRASYLKNLRNTSSPAPSRTFPWHR